MTVHVLNTEYRYMYLTSEAIITRTLSSDVPRLVDIECHSYNNDILTRRRN